MPTISALFLTALTLSSEAFIQPTCHRSTALSARKRAKDTSDGTSEEGAGAKPSPAKLSALEGVLSRIERNYGRGSIQKLGDADRMVVDCVGSGSMTLGEFR
jgi:hypothetical protein